MDEANLTQAQIVEAILRKLAAIEMDLLLLRRKRGEKDTEAPNGN